MGRKNTIILIHGRGVKPPKYQLEAIWTQSLRFALKRDHPSRLPLLDQSRVVFVYYGHYSNNFLNAKRGKKPPPNFQDRKDCLERLTRYRANEFTEANFKSLPGYPPRGDSLAGGLGALAQKLHLGRQVVELAARDIGEYWHDNDRFGKKVRGKLLDPIREAIDRKDRILVIAHSLGSIIAYDAFWTLSRSEQYKKTRYAKAGIDLWITLGSPLGEETAWKMLQGARSQGLERFPANVRRWINLCAEEDYICGRACLQDRYGVMVESGLVKSIEEKRVFNLAVRDGKCSPHSPIGYLVQPEISHAVSAWLENTENRRPSAAKLSFAASLWHKNPV